LLYGGWARSLAFGKPELKASHHAATALKAGLSGGFTGPVGGGSLVKTQGPKAGWNYIISHCSGEPEDTFMDDSTVAPGGVD